MLAKSGMLDLAEFASFVVGCGNVCVSAFLVWYFSRRSGVLARGMSWQLSGELMVASFVCFFAGCQHFDVLTDLDAWTKVIIRTLIFAADAAISLHLVRVIARIESGDE